MILLFPAIRESTSFALDNSALRPIEAFVRWAKGTLFLHLLMSRLRPQVDEAYRTSAGHPTFQNGSFVKHDRRTRFCFRSSNGALLNNLPQAGRLTSNFRIPRHPIRDHRAVQINEATTHPSPGRHSDDQRPTPFFAPGVSEMLELRIS